MKKDRFVKKYKQTKEIHSFLEKLQNTQEAGAMEERRHDAVKVVSVWGVPDLTYKCYRFPKLKRQFIVTLNSAMETKDFKRLIGERLEKET